MNMCKIPRSFDRQLVRLVISRAIHKIKTGQVILSIYKIRNVVSTDVSKMLYFCLVHCHRKYCIVLWGTATNKIAPIYVMCLCFTFSYH